MNYYIVPHPDDPCYNLSIRLFENDFDDEREQDINDFNECESQIEELLISKNNNNDL